MHLFMIFAILSHDFWLIDSVGHSSWGLYFLLIRGLKTICDAGKEK